MNGKLVTCKHQRRLTLRIGEERHRDASRNEEEANKVFETSSNDSDFNRNPGECSLMGEKPVSEEETVLAIEISESVRSGRG